MSWGSAPRTIKSAAALPVEFLGGPSVFETIRVYDGAAAGSREHILRLRGSACSSGIAVPSVSIFQTRFKEALKRSGMRNAVARLAVNAVNAVNADMRGGRSIMSCSVRAFDGCPHDWYLRGVAVVTAAVRRAGPRSAMPQVKGSDYLNALAALGSGPALAAQSGESGERCAGLDPLLLTDAGTVSETSVANLMIVRGDVLWTPPASCGILLGVTRRIVLEAAARQGLKVRTAAFTRHDIYNADEAFLTNAAIEVLPVTEVDRRRIGGGKPGAWAPLLRSAYLSEALGR